MIEKKQVTAKNVGSFMVDVKQPGISYEASEGGSKINLGRTLRKRWQIPKWRIVARGGVVFVGIFLILGLGMGILNFSRIKAAFEEKGARIVQNFNYSLDAFRNLDLITAKTSLEANNNEFSSVSRLFGKTNEGSILKSLTSALPLFKDAGTILRSIADLNLEMFRFVETLQDFKINGFSYFQSDGASLLKTLDDSGGFLKNIINIAENVRNEALKFKLLSNSVPELSEIFGPDYLSHLSRLRALEDFFGALKKFFRSDAERNIALLFYNPAEIRPAGGFLGSYGVLKVKEGQMSALEVGDIYWPDHPMNLSLKVIPPEPLQTITKDWGARDASWFFDFPTSAEAVLGFFEESKIYKDPGIHFDAAIALNIHVLQSIVESVGPILLPEYDLEINGENFLFELQREVEAGKDKIPGKNPKRILAVLAPLLIERMQNLTEEEKAVMFDALITHVEKKNIMFFSREKAIADFLRDSNLDGRVYEMPSSFWGTYLAVVNTNIAGGKSDAFISEHIEGRIDIDTDGGVFVDLGIRRTHSGQDEKDLWWRTTNKNFIKIFTNPDSIIGFVKGNDTPPATSRFNYVGSGYVAHPILQAIETTKKTLTEHRASSYEEFGKRVYAVWLSVAAGKSRTLQIRYEIPSGKDTIVAPGKVYRVVFDRQSGTDTRLKIAVNAPLGYIFKESSSPIYVLEIDDPDRRVVLDLTLMRQ